MKTLTYKRCTNKTLDGFNPLIEPSALLRPGSGLYSICYQLASFSPASVKVIYNSNVWHCEQR